MHAGSFLLINRLFCSFQRDRDDHHCRRRRRHYQRRQQIHLYVLLKIFLVKHLVGVNLIITLYTTQQQSNTRLYSLVLEHGPKTALYGHMLKYRLHRRKMTSIKIFAIVKNAKTVANLKTT